MSIRVEVPPPAPAAIEQPGLAAANVGEVSAASERLTPITDPLVSFIVPAYNEATYIREVLTRVAEVPLRKEIIVVDDGSTDSTPAKLTAWQHEFGGTVIRHQRNSGKGAAVRTGIAHSKGDIVVIQDADMEYDPVDVPALVEPISDGYADVVYGSRLSGGRAQRAYMFWHLVGNRALALITNILFNTTLSDMETGYKAFRGEILRGMSLSANDFRIEPEMTGHVLRRRLRLYQVPISYFGRSYDEGKKISWRDGFPALGTLLRMRFTPRV